MNVTIVLQINLHCCKEAQSLLHQVAVEKEADYILVSEPHHAEGHNWHNDSANKAAVINEKSAQLDEIGGKEPGFSWVLADGVKMYSCYWSPNSTHTEFLDFLARLEVSLRSTQTEVLIAGDFNSHHFDWGSRSCNKRGEALSDLIHAHGLVICNTGNTPTFHNRNGSSIIDLTIASPALAARITDWEVLDTTSLSDHNYIKYKINKTTAATPQEPPKWNFRKVNCHKLESTLKARTLELVTCNLHAEECAQILTSVIQDACKDITPPPPTNNRRKSVYWWSPEISLLRKTANHTRRIYQRKKKRAGPLSCQEEELHAKESKLNLVKAIKKAKDSMWKKLCDQVEHDPWGMPYKLVMGKLGRPSPIPGLNTPGRMDSILLELFPRHPARLQDRWSPINTQEETESLITTDELQKAARSLKINTAPGPDGITNAVLKSFVRCQPEFLLKVYNRCITEGHFPTTWKTARLVLLRKGDKPLDAPSSYRPLCILDCPGKLFEKIIDNRLRDFLEVNNRLDQRQYGFRKGRSTTDAVNEMRNIVETSGPKKKVGVLTLDIKNAFNSAPWADIIYALEDKDIPKYLRGIISSYLGNRTLLVTTEGNTKRMNISSGVPQGSVLGPTLWNILYDGLLRSVLPTGVSFLAFADDVALVAVAKDSLALGQQLSVAAETVKKWLTDVGLHLAIHKSEALVITNKRKHNNMTLNIDGDQIEAGKSLKYLGLQIDAKLNFTLHAKSVAAKASKVVQNISKILPNISMAKPRKRRLIGSVAQSILLYGAPNWADKMSIQGKKEITRVQRKTALRIASAYSTVSTEASQILADFPPIELLATERREVYIAKRSTNTTDPRNDARRNLLIHWQHTWDSSTKGRWTYRLIKNVEQWYKRKHGEVSFHLTQAFSGHGCFASYLHKIGKAPSPACWYCDSPIDDAEHTIFNCDAWYHRRRRLEVDLGEVVHPDSIVEVMLKSDGNWTAVREFVKFIISKKEDEERRRQNINTV